MDSVSLLLIPAVALAIGVALVLRTRHEARQTIRADHPAE